MKAMTRKRLAACAGVSTDTLGRYIEANRKRLVALGYKERLIRINSLIEEQPADCRFAVGFFDINHLERINTLYGFAAGDEILLGLAEMLQKIYGQKNVFRIASDEFIAVMEGKGLLEMKEYGDALDAAVSGFNGEREGKPALSFSSTVRVRIIATVRSLSVRRRCWTGRERRIMRSIRGRESLPL